VRYVLEGSVRKAGGRVRITGQLIDSTNGGHLWADKFDGSLDDVFDLQDKITEQVVGVIAPRVERAEVARLRLTRTNNFSAYDLCLRAFENMRLFSAEGLTAAIELCRQAIALDPTFSTAYGVATRCFVFRRVFSLMQDEAAEIAEGTAFAKQAVATGQDDAYALSAAANFYGSVLFEMELAESLVNQAITVNPNLVETWRNRGFISTYVGKHEAAISQLETALRLSPIDPDIHSTYLVMSTAHLYLRKFDDALVWSAKALARRPQMVVARRSAIAANVALGNLDEARRMMAEAQKLEPQMTISRLQQVMPHRRPEDRAFMVECMRQAGMPE
jgi:tetratricopeptide (TPR) repeat protein